MNIKVTSQALESIQTEALVLPTFEGETPDPHLLRPIDEPLGGLLAYH